MLLIRLKIVSQNCYVNMLKCNPWQAEAEFLP